MSSRFKQALRKIIIAKRKQITTGHQAYISMLIARKIANLDHYKRSRHIALYQAYNNEISLNSIWHSASLQGKTCYFPIIIPSGTLLFLPAGIDTPFKLNRYNIPEPDIALQFAIAPEELDILFMPLVAFDVNKNRIGMGAGYYDKTLALSRPELLIGVGYQFQCCSLINPEPWDIRLSAIVTEQTIYW